MLQVEGAKRHHGWMKHTVSYGKTYRKYLEIQVRNSMRGCKQAGWSIGNIKLVSSSGH